MTAMDPLERRRQENIAGYVIGMWQVEDLMRALELDIDRVEERLVASAEGDEGFKAGLRGWYGGIVSRMKEQGLERSGHLYEVEEVMNELEYLHRALLDTLRDADYQAIHAKARPAIEAVQRQAGGDPEGDVTSALTGVYGVMLLRTQGKAISPETEASDKALRDLLDRLSQHYRQMRRLPGVSLN